MSKLKTEIQQSKPFECLEIEAFLNLIRSASLHSNILDECFQKYGLTMSTYNILRILRGQKETGMPITEVSKRMVIRAPDITRSINKIEKLGFVTKDKSQKDKRVTYTKITTSGLGVLAMLDDPVTAIVKKSFGNLNEDEIKILIHLLEKAQ